VSVGILVIKFTGIQAFLWTYQTWNDMVTYHLGYTTPAANIIDIRWILRNLKVAIHTVSYQKPDFAQVLIFFNSCLQNLYG